MIAKLGTSEAQPLLIVVMGPAGAGKSTVGSAAAEALGVPFFEGDDFHPPENVAKIRAGHALSNLDRIPWLAAIGAAHGKSGASLAVLSCSALNGEIRDMLRAEVDAELIFFLLDVPEAELLRRLGARKGHFAGPELLRSQLAAMDGAEEAVRLDGTEAIPLIVQRIVARARQQSSS